MSEACPLCDSGTGILKFEKNGLHYMRCQKCDFRFGRSDSNANFQTRIGDFEPAYLQYLEIGAADELNHAAALAWIEARVPLGDGVSVLDVGTGSGKFLQYITSHRQCQAAGLEPSTALYSNFDLSGLGIINKSLPDFAAGYTGEGYDVVTAFDVIEHVQSPVDFARSLHAITRPGGLVFLSTPDVGSLVARMLGRRWHHYNRYHFSLFDRRSMASLARRGGFELIDLSHHGKRFTLGYALDYVRDFLLPGRHATVEPRRQNFTFSLNMHDTMSVVWNRQR